MAEIRKLEEALLKDERGCVRVVPVGAFVDLKPDACNREWMRTTFLGQDGPYQISWIGQWPCGRVSIYLKLPGREPGAHASDFRFSHYS
ncbi:MAG TPA: hypothetical protein VI953_05045 [Candidatus Paceibacterota bacterium]